jgi:hypothetical protein
LLPPKGRNPRDFQGRERLPGTTKLHRLEENLGAAALKLTIDDLRDIEAAASQITVHGARYSEQHEQLTGR